MSAFFCFQMARRAGLKQEAPDLNHKDIIKVSHSPYLLCQNPLGLRTASLSVTYSIMVRWG